MKDDNHKQAAGGQRNFDDGAWWNHLPAPAKGADQVLSPEHAAAVGTDAGQDGQALLPTLPLALAAGGWWQQAGATADGREQQEQGTWQERDQDSSPFRSRWRHWVTAAACLLLGVCVGWMTASIGRSGSTRALTFPPPGGAAATHNLGAAGAASLGLPSAQSVGPVAVVDVVGDVRRPGVYQLPANDRVMDVVKAAGGFLHAGDAVEVNQAAPVTDGEEIVIPGPAASTGGGATAGTSTPAGSGAGGVSGGMAAAAGGGTAVVGLHTIDLNTADAATLETLPGIGPRRAADIIAWRTAHGLFLSVASLRQIRGFGPKTLARIGPYLFVSR